MKSFFNKNIYRTLPHIKRIKQNDKILKVTARYSKVYKKTTASCMLSVYLYTGTKVYIYLCTFGVCYALVGFDDIEKQSRSLQPYNH